MRERFERTCALAGASRASRRRAKVAALFPAVLSFACTASHGHSVRKGDRELDYPYAVPSLAGDNDGATSTSTEPDRRHCETTALPLSNLEANLPYNRKDDEHCTTQRGTPQLERP